jgi:hypothetical protein
MFFNILCNTKVVPLLSVFLASAVPGASVFSEAQRSGSHAEKGDTGSEVSRGEQSRSELYKKCSRWAMSLAPDVVNLWPQMW